MLDRLLCPFAFNPKLHPLRHYLFWGSPRFLIENSTLPVWPNMASLILFLSVMPVLNGIYASLKYSIVGRYTHLHFSSHTWFWYTILMGAYRENITSMPSPGRKPVYHYPVVWWWVCSGTYISLHVWNARRQRWVGQIVRIYHFMNLMSTCKMWKESLPIRFDFFKRTCSLSHDFGHLERNKAGEGFQHRLKAQFLKCILT